MPRELVVISGKGGTGKTSILASFAYLAENMVLCDADVDAADLHLLMDPQVRERHDFQGGGVAVIDPAKCTQCGLCTDLCRWNAIGEEFKVDALDCEGCGVCVYLCPEKAVEFPTKTCGEWFSSDTRFGPMVHARLGIAEENSGKLVTLVRQEAKKLAERENRNLIVTDGPPGVGCPVIASIGGAAAVLVVAEPTISGRHDMERVLELAMHFRVPAAVCINKSDLNPGEAEAIEAFSKERGLSFLGRIPFDPVFTESMIQGKTVFEYKAKSLVCRAIEEIWDRASEVLAGE